MSRLSGYKREVELDLHGMITDGHIIFKDAYFHSTSTGGQFILKKCASNNLILITLNTIKAISLCDSMLQFDPAKRITAREILMHPWIKVFAILYLK